MFGANLVIPAEICDELSYGQGQVYGEKMDGRMNTRTQQYPFGLKGPGVTTKCSWHLQASWWHRLVSASQGSPTYWRVQLNLLIKWYYTVQYKCRLLIRFWTHKGCCISHPCRPDTVSSMSTGRCHNNRDHFVRAPTQWETTLHCNVSHWLGAYTKWSLQ